MAEADSKLYRWFLSLFIIAIIVICILNIIQYRKILNDPNDKATGVSRNKAVFFMWLNIILVIICFITLLYSWFRWATGKSILQSEKFRQDVTNLIQDNKGCSDDKGTKLTETECAAKTITEITNFLLKNNYKHGLDESTGAAVALYKKYGGDKNLIESAVVSITSANSDVNVPKAMEIATQTENELSATQPENELSATQPTGQNPTRLTVVPVRPLNNGNNSTNSSSDSETGSIGTYVSNPRSSSTETYNGKQAVIDSNRIQMNRPPIPTDSVSSRTVSVRTGISSNSGYSLGKKPQIIRRIIPTMPTSP